MQTQIEAIVKEKLDTANIRSNKTIVEELDANEQILLSTLIIKVNQDNVKQERILLITNKAVYNIKPKGEISQIIGRQCFINARLLQRSQIKRKILISQISALTLANFGNEFVIHVPSEYDYRFQSYNLQYYFLPSRTKILEILAEVYLITQGELMQFFLKDDFILVAYTTTEKDKKKQINRYPEGNPIVMTRKAIVEWSMDSKDSVLVFQQEETKNLKPIGIEDFELIKVLGRGAFGKVMMCEKKDTKELFAVKSLKKGHLIESKQVVHTKTERYLMEQLDHPFLVNLEYAFQTNEKLFFVMKFMRGGELFHHLKIKNRLTEKEAKFYAASIILAFEHLHSLNVVYRDLKPENILMDEFGYVKLSDFGLAKILEPGQRTKSFVGTPEYIAPEIIKQQGHDYAADWWTLGIFIYEMLIGRTPFISQNQMQLFKEILVSPFVFPRKIQVDKKVTIEFTEEIEDLLNKLLRKEPLQRLCDAQAIKAHPWFKDFNFQQLQSKQMAPPIKPKLGNKQDVANFDPKITREQPINSLSGELDPQLVQQFAQEFGPVSYDPNFQE